MFYSKAHVLALEAQIESLKAELKESRLAQETQIEYLKGELNASRLQEKALLDRLLAKNNLEPVQQPPASLPKIPENVIHPYGQVTPEMAELSKESFIGEEMAYLMGEHGMTEEQAREGAEKEFNRRYKAL